MPLNPSGSSARNQPNPATGATLGPNSVKYAVRASQMKRIGPFIKGKTPTLLEAVEATKVANFLENLMWRTVGELRTGSPPDKRFTMDYTPMGNELTLWIPTDLIWDKSPQLGGNLHTNGREIFDLATIFMRAPRFHLYGGGEIRFSPAADKTEFVGLAAPSGGDGTVWTLPSADGSAGQFLKTNGSAVMSWASGGGGMTFDFSDGVNSFSVADTDTVQLTSLDASVTIDCSTADTIDFSASGGGGGGMTSWDLSADSGFAETIENSNTVLLAGGTYLSSVASSTDTVTFNHDNSGVSAGTYGSATQVAQVAVDAQGHITSVSNVTITGGGGMTSWDLSGDSGPTQTISNANTVLIAGGDGISTAASGTDTVTVDIDDTVAQSINLTAGTGGSYSGDSLVNFDNNLVNNSVGLRADKFMKLTGVDASGIVGIEGAPVLDFTADDSGSGVVDLSTESLELLGSGTQSSNSNFIVTSVDAVINKANFTVGKKVMTTAGTGTDGGTASGDATINVGNNATGNLTFVAGTGIELTGADFQSTLKIACELDPWTGEKTAIVKSSDPDPDSYEALYCTESPEVRFEDVVTIHPPENCLDFRHKFDPEFLHACEPDSIKAVGHTMSTPAIVGIVIEGGEIKLEFSKLLPVPKEVVVHLMGIRAGHEGKRFATKTREQSDRNLAFWGGWEKG